MKIQYHVYHSSWKEFLFIMLEGAAIWCVLDYLFYRSVKVLWLGGIWLFCFYRWSRKQKLIRRKKELHYHFKDVLTAMKTAVQARLCGGKCGLGGGGGSADALRSEGLDGKRIKIYAKTDAA